MLVLPDKVWSKLESTLDLHGSRTFATTEDNRYLRSCCHTKNGKLTHAQMRAPANYRLLQTKVRSKPYPTYSPPYAGMRSSSTRWNAGREAEGKDRGPWRSQERQCDSRGVPKVQRLQRAFGASKNVHWLLDDAELPSPCLRKLIFVGMPDPETY